MERPRSETQSVESVGHTPRALLVISRITRPDSYACFQIGHVERPMWFGPSPISESLWNYKAMMNSYNNLLGIYDRPERTQQ